jgi:hypothetical protein
MSTNVTWNGTTYSIPAAGEVGWSALSNFLIALGNGAAVSEEMKQAVRVATTSPVTVSDTTDCVVVTDLGTPGAVTVNLPAGTTGRIFMVVDGKGDAATNNVTIDGNGAETINGAATYAITDNRGAVAIAWNGTGWNIVARFIGGSFLTNPMDSAGDMIYGGVAGAPTKLDNGASGQLMMANGASAPTWVDTVTGAKTFSSLLTGSGGLARNEYIGTNPEVGGSSPFQLTVSHKRLQTISPAGAITTRLPTTSVAAGDVWEICNRSASDVTIQSSNGDEIDIIRAGFIRCIALQATPTALAHWYILDVLDGAENATTSVTTDTGTVSATFTYSARRFGSGPVTLAGSRAVNLWVKCSGTTSTGSPTEVGIAIATRFCQSSSSFRTTSLGGPTGTANILTRLKVEESGNIYIGTFNVSTGAASALGASFDLRATHSYARQT